MKKVTLGLFIFSLVFVLSGCVGLNEKAAEKVPGKFFEIGSLNFAWGGETHTVCNDGRVYSKASNVDYAKFLGSLTAPEILELQELLGTKTIVYEETFDDPDLFDDDHSLFLNYIGASDSQNIDYDKYSQVKKSLENMIKSLDRQEVVSIRRDSAKESILQWQDSKILSFKSYLKGDDISIQVNFTDFNAQQLEIINRMRNDYLARGLDASVAEYRVEEEGFIYGVEIYNQFLSIVAWPRVVYSMDQMTKLFSVEASQLTDMDHVTAERLEVAIENVTDSDFLDRIRERKGESLLVVWQENGRKMGSKYDFSLAFSDPQVGLNEICK